MKRDHNITELMDDPNCDPAKLLRTYKQFRFVNRMFSSWNSIYKQFIRPKLTDKNITYTLLDVGCGLMDNSRYIQKLALQDGFKIEISGLDPNPVVSQYFNSAGLEEGVHFISSFLHEIDSNLKYDFVISNHLIHHLENSEITDLHHQIANRTQKLAIMNDIHRSFWAYVGFSIITLPYIGWTFIHTDGRRSIKRSLDSDELNSLLPDDWLSASVFPFRLFSVYEAS